MGFYLRKSVSVGPLRFNLSKAGIGLSAGIKGLRIGTGPRGHYVQMARGGIYFRQTLPNWESRPASPVRPAELPSGIELESIESSGVSEMADSSSAALLDEISSKSKRPRIWPFVLSLSIAV